MELSTTSAPQPRPQHNALLLTVGAGPRHLLGLDIDSSSRGGDLQVAKGHVGAAGRMYLSERFWLARCFCLVLLLPAAGGAAQPGVWSERAAGMVGGQCTQHGTV